MRVDAKSTSSLETEDIFQEEVFFTLGKVLVAYSGYVIPFILSLECYIISQHCPTNPNVCRDASRTFEYLHKV